MRTTLRTLSSALAFTSLASFALAQDAQNQRPNAQPAVNPQVGLPYGAKDDKPVSKWTPPASAGRQLTLNDLLTWKTIRTPILSNDGKWFVYGIGPNEGDAEVVIRGTAAGAKESRFATGTAPAAGGGGGGGFGGGAAALGLSGNGRWAAFLIYPSSATPRRGGGRPGAGGPGGAAGANAPATPTKLGVVSTADGTKREFENVRAFRFAGDKSDWLAVHHAAPATTGAGAGGGAGGGNAAGTLLELVNLGAPAGTPAVTIANVSEFAFDDGADWVAYAVSIADQVGNSVQVRQLSTGITRSLDATKATYRRLSWADSSDALAAIRVVTDTSANSSNEENVTALVWQHASSATAKTVEITPSSVGVPSGLVLSADYAVNWGDASKVLYIGLREPRPPRARATTPFNGTTTQGVAPGAGNTGQVAAAPQTDADVPSLILWHWKDPRTQATQQVQENQDRSFSYAGAFQVAANKVVRLTDEKMRTVAIGPKDTWAVGSDNSAYERDAGIKGFQFRDMIAVNVMTGERKVIAKKVAGGGGGGGFGGGGVSAFSPDNSKYAYYEMGDWKVYDFSTGATKSVTAGINNNFYDDEDDHNQVKPGIGGGLVGWSKDGANLIVRDNWDYWRLPVSGTGAVNITGNGRKDQIRYQTRLVADARLNRYGIDLAQPMYIETYGEWTKKEGLVSVDGMKGGAKTISWEDNKVDYRRARDADVWAFTRQTVVRFPNWLIADAGLKNERQITDANPQQKDVAWTPGAKLIDYTCDTDKGPGTGQKHQAVLFLPAGYEQGKKYPTLTYIYELLSQGTHAYPQPNATRYSNPAVFTSRGYAFLQPDIVYHVNDPGRSATWCIVPAVKAAIATGIVDSARVGLQGHSWGGYQTTFVTTQTNIFKTAVAGAPLTDMISMFGSVYWNTGNTDGSIFIASQGRFTGGPNDVPEAYMRNSPQVFAEKLNIPFMILHNDRDGAVDFNQGITYYNHLRQLGKEVVLLEYVGENHGLSRAANQKDYALRMTEWFDTFLRDQAPPQWLQDGVPRLKMEAHLKDRRAMTDSKAETRPAIVP
jgi:dipeptidyl aminopeptidase/acylaminoacyl peptidase